MERKKPIWCILGEMIEPGGRSAEIWKSQIGYEPFIWYVASIPAFYIFGVKSEGTGCPRKMCFIPSILCYHIGFWSKPPVIIALNAHTQVTSLTVRRYMFTSDGLLKRFLGNFSPKASHPWMPMLLEKRGTGREHIGCHLRSMPVHSLSPAHIEFSLVEVASGWRTSGAGIGMNHCELLKNETVLLLKVKDTVQWRENYMYNLNTLWM